MKLLHMEGTNPSYYIMVLDEDTATYIYMHVKAGEPDDIMSKFQLADFTDREHFAGVVGKFMPEVWILGEDAEIEIQSPSLPELKRAEAILEERNKSL